MNTDYNNMPERIDKLFEEVLSIKQILKVRIEKKKKSPKF